MSNNYIRELFKSANLIEEEKNKEKWVLDKCLLELATRYRMIDPFKTRGVQTIDDFFVTEPFDEANTSGTLHRYNRQPLYLRNSRPIERPTTMTYSLEQPKFEHSSSQCKQWSELFQFPTVLCDGMYMQLVHPLVRQVENKTGAKICGNLLNSNIVQIIGTAESISNAKKLLASNIQFICKKYGLLSLNPNETHINELNYVPSGISTASNLQRSDNIDMVAFSKILDMAKQFYEFLQSTPLQFNDKDNNYRTKNASCFMGPVSRMVQTCSSIEPTKHISEVKPEINYNLFSLIITISTEVYDRIKSDVGCFLCLRKNVFYAVFLPCGHATVCYTCAQRCTNCTTCGNAITHAFQFPYPKV